MRFIIWAADNPFLMTESQSIPGLIKALSSNTRRFDAAYALMALGGDAVEPLLGALRMDNWEVRGNAAWALGKIGDPRSVEPLIEALDDEVPEVRATAARAILNIGARATEQLLRSLDSGRSKNPGLLACILSMLESEGRDDGRLTTNAAWTG